MPRLDPRGSRTFQGLCRIFRGLRAAWWFFGITLLMLLALELSLRMAFAAKDTFFGVELPDPRLVANGYGGADWARDLFREKWRRGSEWKPYVYFRQKPYQSATTTIDAQGLRRTWQPPNDSETAGGHRSRVWVFGGSAAWGVGARDDFTIPSLIAKELDARGIAVEITNFGEIGYVSTQEILALMLELRRGRRPDLVVFYDGVNDTLAAYRNGRAGWPLNEKNRRRAFANRRSPGRLIAAGLRTWFRDSALKRLAQSIRSRLMTGQGPQPRFPTPVRNGQNPRELAESVLDTYAANRRLVHALADAYDFRPLFYWQPVLFTKKEKRLTPFERDERAKYAGLAPLFLDVYRLARARASREGDDFQDVSGLLDNAKRLLFSDFCHTTEAANAIVARRIAADLAPLLTARTPRMESDGKSEAPDMPREPKTLDGGLASPVRIQEAGFSGARRPIARSRG